MQFYAGFSRSHFPLNFCFRENKAISFARKHLENLFDHSYRINRKSCKKKNSNHGLGYLFRHDPASIKFHPIQILRGEKKSFNPNNESIFFPCSPTTWIQAAASVHSTRKCKLDGSTYLISIKFSVQN